MKTSIKTKEGLVVIMSIALRMRKVKGLFFLWLPNLIQRI